MQQCVFALITSSNEMKSEIIIPKFTVVLLKVAMFVFNQKF